MKTIGQLTRMYDKCREKVYPNSRDFLFMDNGDSCVYLCRNSAGKDIFRRIIHFDSAVEATAYFEK